MWCIILYKEVKWWSFPLCSLQFSACRCVLCQWIREASCWWKQNKIQGIEELYSKYKKVVYGIAFTISKNKEDSEDIMQMIFAKIYEMENSKLPTSNYASWLYSTTKNETINFLKKKKKCLTSTNSPDILYDCCGERKQHGFLKRNSKK